MKNISDTLLSDLPVDRPSFGKGFARGVDLFGLFQTREAYVPMSDEEAFASDWAVVGNDMRRAFEQAGIR